MRKVQIHCSKDQHMFRLVRVYCIREGDHYTPKSASMAQKEERETTKLHTQVREKGDH